MIAWCRISLNTFCLKKSRGVSWCFHIKKEARLNPSCRKWSHRCSINLSKHMIQDRWRYCRPYLGLICRPYIGLKYINTNLGIAAFVCICPICFPIKLALLPVIHFKCHLPSNSIHPLGESHPTRWRYPGNPGISARRRLCSWARSPVSALGLTNSKSWAAQIQGRGEHFFKPRWSMVLVFTYKTGLFMG